jgi:hypothetical protein
VEPLHRSKVDEPYQTASNGSFSSLVPVRNFQNDETSPLWPIHAMTEEVKQSGRKWLRQREAKDVFFEEPEHFGKIRTGGLLDE